MLSDLTNLIATEFDTFLVFLAALLASAALFQFAAVAADVLTPKWQAFWQDCLTRYANDYDLLDEAEVAHRRINDIQYETFQAMAQAAAEQRFKSRLDGTHRAGADTAQNLPTTYPTIE